MEIFVKVNNTQYPASVTGKLMDKDWDNRASKAIRLEMSYDDAIALFVDDVQWSILQEVEVEVEKEREVEVEITEEIVNEDGEVTTETRTETRVETYRELEIQIEEYDNSEYNIAGEITDHRDGTVTVKMGKFTAEEILARLEEVL
jgi:hypothetical protein